MERSWVHAYLLVAAGSALGGAGRFALTTTVDLYTRPGFPWGTVLVNVLGCAVIGGLAALPLSVEARQFLMVGVLGGFTTFSSFSLQTLTLAQEGRWGLAAGNVVASVVVCLAAVFLGYRLGQRWSG